MQSLLSTKEARENYLHPKLFWGKHSKGQNGGEKRIQHGKKEEPNWREGRGVNAEGREEIEYRK
jgi:hypothetical protein